MADSTPLTAPIARHLLRRAGFGARPDDVDKLLGDHATLGAAVDALLDFEPTRFRPGGRYIEDAHNKWLKYMIKAKKVQRQLQEKLVCFWHDHFAASFDDVENVKLMREQNRLLRIHCKGNFGELVKAINQDAAMMEFLDTVRNRKKVPNENYARELLELFMLGVTAPVPDGGGAADNYEQEDIVQIARAFTGWDYDDKGRAEFPLNSSGGTKNSRHDYMADYPERGPKVVFKNRGGFNAPSGQSFTSGGEGANEIDEVIDVILQHRYGPPGAQRNTVADHIAAKLIAYFAHPNPSLAYVQAVVDASGFASSFEIAPLLRAIFVHDDFLLSIGPPSAGAKKSVKWPIDFVVGTVRVLGMKLKGKYQQVQGGDYPYARDALTNMGQILLQPPSVFGWDWETAWVSSSTLLARYAWARDLTGARGGGSTAFRPERQLTFAMTVQPADFVVDEVAKLLGVFDQLEPAEHQALVDYLTDGPAPPGTTIDLGDDETRSRKLNGLVATILQSPTYQLH